MIQAQPPSPLDPPESEAYAEAKEDEDLARVANEAAVRFLAGDPDGRHFLRLLLDWTGLLAPAGSERREGERAVGRKLMLLMYDVDPMIFPSLLADGARVEQDRRKPT